MGSRILTKESSWCDVQDTMTAYTYIAYCAAENDFTSATVPFFLNRMLFNEREFEQR